MRIKSGVSLLGLKPEMIVVLIIVEPIIQSYGQECVITSGVEGKHSKKTSKHYVGYGLDLRSRDFYDDEQAEDCAHTIREALGDEFYVAFEKNHFHISYNGSIK